MNLDTIRNTIASAFLFRHTTAPKTALAVAIPTSKTSGFQEHPAPHGDAVKRYSPHGFPAPVWSLDDLHRPDGAKYSKVTGKILLKDRRKDWQKKSMTSNFDRTGSIHTWKRTPKA